MWCAIWPTVFKPMCCNKPNTVECRFNTVHFIPILRTALRWQRLGHQSNFRITFHFSVHNNGHHTLPTLYTCILTWDQQPWNTPYKVNAYQTQTINKIFYPVCFYDDMRSWESYGKVISLNAHKLKGRIAGLVTRSLKAFKTAWIMHIDGLVQERRNFSALAMELRLFCTKPSI